MSHSTLSPKAFTGLTNPFSSFFFSLPTNFSHYKYNSLPTLISPRPPARWQLSSIKTKTKQN
jgi:hypothetical protein